MTASHAVEDRIFHAIRSLQIPHGARVLVGVSGGADSVALLRAVHMLGSTPEQRWSVRVGHVNHGLRGVAAHGDERFVVELAKNLRLHADVRHVDVMAHAKQHRFSIEESARELRRAALLSMLDDWEGDVLALGHTLDDQAETLVLRLLRGTGLTGLRGMQEWSGRVVRPLISIERSALTTWLSLIGQEHRVDRSNNDPRYRRNRVRHEIMPVLQAVQADAGLLLARSAHNLRIDADFLAREAEDSLSLIRLHAHVDEVTISRSAWLSLHLALRRQTLRLLIQSLLGHLKDIEEMHLNLIEQTIEQAPVALVDQLPHHLAVYADDTTVSVRCRARPSLPAFPPHQWDVPGILKVGGWTFEASYLVESSADSRRAFLATCGPMHALCDSDYLGTRLFIRSRQPGDRLKPHGMSGSRKLQDVMVDRHVPVGTRDALPVIVNEHHIVWVPGLAIDRRAAVHSTSKRVLHLLARPGSMVE